MIAKKQKELRTRVRPGTALLEIYYENGGELPKELTGGYTSAREAQKNIDSYLSKKNKNATGSEQ